MPKKPTSKDSIVLFLVRVRLYKRLTQQQVADHCPAISLRTLQRIEQGKCDMTISQFRSLCDFYCVTSLDVSLGELRYRSTSAEDIAATAKLLPKPVQTTLVDLMVAVAEEFRRRKT
ncbi:helix-turn-helix domain-containing protein [Photobacterium ganghwense]|uniref:helix-turn-helix domain-containing protein n=1 Tax=Photobacterium ganghwense TaxID=320778 RepID=UPI0039EEA77C